VGGSLPVIGRLLGHTQAQTTARYAHVADLAAILRVGDLVVWKLDRLSRSLKQLVETVENLAARDIGFQCLTHDIDTTSASGKLVFGIFAALAEFERELISERTKAGLKAAAARGRKLSATVVAGVRARLAAGEDVATVARDSSVARSTLWRAFKS